MDNPVLVELINDLPLLLDNPGLVQRFLDLTHAGIDRNAAHIDELAAQLEELRGVQRALRETPVNTEEEDTVSALEDIAAGYETVLQQQRQMNQVLQFLLVVRAVAYARSRSRLVPGVLLAAASAAVFPGFRTFVRLSVLTLGFLFGLRF
uniref:Uncharacterized protein n=1 Tax=Avena sativa TaxID=4498 RepID=A0ACD5W2D2_AVESA